MAARRNAQALDGQTILEQARKALAGHVKVVVGIAVEWLKKGRRAKKFAAWFQNPRDLRGALDRVADMLEHCQGNDRVER